MNTVDAAVNKALDQIDAYNYSAAEATVTAAFAKFGTTNIDLQIVHSLVLQRQGHDEESSSLAKRFAADPTILKSLREGSINVLAHVLQNGCCYKELALVYERSIDLVGGPESANATPAQENLLNAYILAEDLPAAQRIAMLMHKKTGKHEFLIRGMMCNIAQVPDDCKDHVLLKISTKMLGSVLNPGSDSAASPTASPTSTTTAAAAAAVAATPPPSSAAGGKKNKVNPNAALNPQTCLMFVNLLLQQGLYDEAISYVLSRNGKYLGLPEQRYVVLLKALQKKAAAASSSSSEAPADVNTLLCIVAVAKQAWALDPDNWSFADCYIRAVEAVEKALPQPQNKDNEENNAVLTIIPFESKVPTNSSSSSASACACTLKEPLFFPKPKWADLISSSAFVVPSFFSGKKEGAGEGAVVDEEGWSVDASLSSALSFIVRTQQNSPKSAAKCLRGPFMAELTILLLQYNATGDAAQKKALADVITEKAISYTARFDSKGVCYLDLATLFANHDCAPAAIAAVISNLKAEEDAIEKDITNATATAAAPAAAAAEGNAKKAATDNGENKENASSSLVIAIHRKRILRMKLELLATPIDGLTEDGMDRLGAMIPQCIAHYEACRPLSAGLEWSEEGIVDGYLLIVGNVALRQWYYYRSADVAAAGGVAGEPAAPNPALVGMANRALITALDAFTSMDRKKNNPGTLLFSTLFYQQLGIADTASLDQLDFKSIQHSSMHHVACQPLLRGCAFSEVHKYFSHSYDRYYALGKKEVGKLIGKVFVHTSWPKMGELKAFEGRLLRGLPRQESLVFSALCKLRDMQTMRYTQMHAVRSARNVEGALVAACRPLKHLGYGDAPAIAAVAAAASSPATCTLASLWESINDPTCCDEALPEEDEQFLMAYVFADLKSPESKRMQRALLDRDGRKWRRQQVVLGAVAMLLLHDLGIYEAKRAAATIASTPAATGAKKNAKPSAAMLAAQQAAKSPYAQRPFLSKRYAITSEAVKGLAATLVASRCDCPASSSYSGGVDAATVGAAKKAIEVLAGMADVVGEMVEAVGAVAASTNGGANVTTLQTSEARERLAALFKEGGVAASLKDLENPAAALGPNAPCNYIAGAAFAMLFPVGIALSAFLMLVPYPAEIASALHNGLLKEIKHYVAAAVDTATAAAADSDADAVTKAIDAAKVSNLKSFFRLVDDLSAEVGASSKRKQ